MKKILKKTIIGFASGLLIAGLTYLFMNFLLPDLWVTLENKTYDLRYNLKYSDVKAQRRAIQDGVQTSNTLDDVVITDIDERSMLAENLGLYYRWPRSVHSDFVQYLKSGNAAATAFDIHFNDPDYGKKETARILNIFRGPEASKMVTPAEIDKLSPIIHSGVNFDSILVYGTRRAGNVIHAMIVNDSSNYANRSDYLARTTEEHRLASNPGSAYKMEEAVSVNLRKYPVLDGAFPELAQAATRIGLVNVEPDEDGIHRTLALFNIFRGYAYPVLSLQTCLFVMGKTLADIRVQPGKMVDLGRPFYLEKQKDNTLRVSYPGVNEQMIRALLEKSAEARKLKEGASLTVTEKAVIVKDDKGVVKADLLQGMLSLSSIRELNGVDVRELAKLNLNEPAQIGAATGIMRTGPDAFSVVELQNNQKSIDEIPLATLAALAAVDGQKVAALRNGESFTASEPMSVTRKNGTLRTEYILLRNEALEELMALSGKDLDALKTGDRREFGTAIRIPVDRNCRIRLNYKGPARITFKTISYYDIWKKRVPADYFCGKVFLVGSAAVSMGDIVNSAVEKDYPGVEIHATAMTDIINNDFMRDPNPKFMFLIVLGMAVFIGVAAMFIKPFISIIIVILSSLSYFVFLAMPQFDANLNLEVVRPMFGMFGAFILAVIYRYVTEERDKQFLKATFQNYLSVELIDQMYENRQFPQLGGEEGIRTAFFTDIQGFSTFSEKLGSPTKLVELLNEYLTAQTDILMANGGTLDKYEGDAILAFFGAPMPLPDHADKAALTAIGMQRNLANLRSKWVSEGEKWPDIVHKMRMRIGFNSGPIVTGNMGSKKRMNYTMMGDAVNLAARLEGAAKQYGVFTMFSHYTKELLSDKFEIRELDKITVVGKSEPVTIFELIEEKGKIEPRLTEMVQLYLEALGFYKKQEWDSAISFFEKALILETERFPDQKTNPSKVYIARCHEFKLNPPGADWDGVYQLTSK